MICQVLGEDESKLDRQEGDVSTADLGLDRRRQQDDVDGRGDEEEQDALDERDEGPVEEVEHEFGNMLPDDLP